MFTQTPAAQQRDFGKVKMWRQAGDPLAEAMFKALGVTPIPLPLTEVRTSLQTGLINGVYVSALGAGTRGKGPGHGNRHPGNGTSSPKIETRHSPAWRACFPR